MNNHKVMRFGCSFGGGGGGGAGCKESRAELWGMTAQVELCGSFDSDEFACGVYQYLTGSEQTCVDIREMTPAMYREVYGEEAPFAFLASEPCQGSSKLLSAAKSRTALYRAMNELTLVNLLLLIGAYAPELLGADGQVDFTVSADVRRAALKKLPAFLLSENVPNITSRASGMLGKVKRILTWIGYVWQDGFHECRHVGNLAQRRKRYFRLARNPEKIPAFVYLPPHQPGLVCGDVLNPLPMPGSEAGGAMHRLPEISSLNLWRLWKIPAGGDWRDLLPDDGTPRCARFRRHHIEKMSEPSVTIGGSGSNGPCGIADDRPLDLAVFREGAGAFHHKYGIACSNKEAPTITTAANLGEGMPCYADPIAVRLGDTQDRFHHVDRVTAWNKATGAVTHSPAPSSGAIAVSDPRPLDLEPQKGNAGRHYDKYAVRRWDTEALTVHSATRVGSGAPSIAQPLAMKESSFHHGCGQGKLGVLSASAASSCVTGNARVATGPFNYAAPIPEPLNLVPRDACYDKGYAVLSKLDPSNTVAGNSAVGCGTYSIADDVPEVHPVDLTLGCSPRSGAYGVIDDIAPTVIGSAQIDNAAVAIADPKPVPPPFVVLSYEQAKLVADGLVAVPFAVIDEAHPEVPLCIVDDMSKTPFRWVEKIVGRGKRAKTVRTKEPVTLVLISADGTWHRPLTTLELAVLQGLPWQHNGAPLDFGGGSTKQREVVGNMIPKPVGTAFGRQLLVAGLASASGVFIYGGGSGLWVKREHAEALAHVGVRRVRQQDIAHLRSDEMVILDDSAPVSRRRKKASYVSTTTTFEALRRILSAEAPAHQEEHAVH